MPVSLNVRGIGVFKHKLSNFALTTVYIPGLDRNGREVYTSITCELHLVDGLKINMLIGNNLLCTEGFIINFSSSSAFIHSCSIRININARQHSKFLKYRALTSTFIIIFFCLEALVAF